MVSKEVKKNLTLLKKLTSGVETLIGPFPRVKCVIDNEDYMMTSSGVNYLKALKFKHWIYDHLYETCFDFHERYGFGSEMYLTCIHLWCQYFIELINMDIPMDVLRTLTLEILHVVFDQLESSCSNQTVDTIYRAQVTRATKPVKPPQKTLFTSKKMNFSRYSRHAMMQEETQDDEGPSDSHEVSKVFEYFFQYLKNSDSELYSNLLELLLTIHKDQLPNSVSNLQISTENIIAECEALTPNFEQRVFDGVLIACFGHEYFDLLEKYNGLKAHLNVVLVNRIAYGDNLGDIKIQEVISFTAARESPLNRYDGNYDGLIANSIQVIFYRGDIEDSLVQYCSDHRIILIPVPDYNTLFRIHRMTEANILYDTRTNLSKSDVAKIAIGFKTLRPCVEIIGKKIRIDKPTCGYILVKNSSRQTEHRCRFYTVFLSSRGKDLQFLQQEKFNNVLSETIHLLSSKTICPGMVEQRLKALLKSRQSVDVERSSFYETLPWLQNDMLLFENLVKPQLLKMFENYIILSNTYCQRHHVDCPDVNQKSGGSPKLEDVCMKRATWMDSFDFVTHIMSTIQIENN